MNHISDLPRFFCSDLQSSMAELDKDQSRHLIKVLRLKESETVELFDGKGNSAKAVISQISKTNVTLSVNSISYFQQPVLKIIIALSHPKGQRFDWCVSKCTELGVDRIIPVIFQRTVKQPPAAAIRKRFEKIAIAACKQCRRNHLPELSEPMSLPEAIQKTRLMYPGVKLYAGASFESSMENKNISELCNIISHNAVFIGPEGGYTPEEVQLLQSEDVNFVQLTNYVLRIETASLAFAALLCSARDIVQSGTQTQS